MTATTTGTGNGARRNLARVYLLEAKYEFLKLLRLPAYSVSTVVFPLMFFLIFGSAFGAFTSQGVSIAAYLLATYGALGVINGALFGFGAGVAGERAQGWMLLKRVSPMPPLAYFVAKIVMALLFGLLVVVTLAVAAFLVQGVVLSFGQYLTLVGTLLAGTLPFAALGLAFGYSLGPNSAPTVLNLVNLPMAFASGLYIPISQLPPVVGHIAPYLPAYHLGQLALGAIGGQPLGQIGGHVLALLGFTALFLVLALIAYRRDEGRTYG